MNTPSQVSFLPDDYLDAKRQRRSNTLCAALFLIVVAGIGSAFLYMQRTMEDVDRELTRVATQCEEAAGQIAQLGQMQEKQRTMEAQAALTASLIEKVPRSCILAQITNARPQGVSLLDFSLESKVHSAPAVAQPAPSHNKYQIKRAQLEAQRNAAVAAAPEAKVYDVYFHLTGVAENDVQVAAYIKALSACTIFNDVNLLVSDEYEDNKVKMRRFQIDFSLDPQADVRDQSKPRHAPHALVNDPPATRPQTLERHANDQ